MEINNNNISELNTGLHTDTSPQNQPKGTQRFALNTVNESDNGDEFFRSNEESNEICDSLTPDFIPIGKGYIGNNETIIFSVHKNNSISEIGVLNNNCEYEVFVNDEDSIDDDKLNFKVEHQIQATYRLRRGCERTVYWIDDFNKPRYFNFDKPQDFKNVGDLKWNANKFNLQKTYSKIPAFNKIEVLDSGGNLEPGSYNIAIQYVDESLNPTEWITTTGTIKIYNDLSSKTYREINGSINSDSDYINFPKTGKAIKVTLSNLDNDFLYYRLAIIESNNGSGQINKVLYTETIPTSKNFFIYTGTNASTLGTQEEVLQAADIIERAGSIEQIENRLILGNTQGKQVNFCKLQKYASRIKADCITKTVILNDINDPSNPKNPTHEIGGLGYMPGEIYSFGIVYIFEDGSLSPTYHIPGKNPSVDASMVFTPIEYSTGPNGEQIQHTFPMSNKDSEGNIINQGQSTYNDNDSCGSNKYWGLDSEGTDLNGKFVRHHRFPLRSSINKPLVVDELSENQTAEYYQLNLKVLGTLKVPYCDKVADPNCTPTELPEFEVRVTYKVNGESFSFIQTINPDLFANGTNDTYPIDLLQNSQYHSSNLFTDITFSVTDVNGNYQTENPITLGTGANTTEDDIYFTDNATYTVTSQLYTSTVQGRLFSTDILGIKFSGIDIPTSQDTNGEKVIGYYIVRNERTEFDKTILDSGILVPCVTNNKYISHGLLQPETNRISPNVYGLIHPEYKFNNKEYVNYDKIIQQGNFNVIDRKLGKVNYDDVYDGTSFNKDKQIEGNDDGYAPDGSPTERGLDGWSFNLITRDNIVSYEQKTSFEIDSTKINDRFYLDALGYKSINDNANDVYNIACDNKVGIVEFKAGTTLPANNNLPYVLLYKENTDPYSNFRVLPYYKENLNPFYFDANNSTSDSCSVFNGDSYVTPMKYVNTMYYDNRVARRSGKRSFWKILVGVGLAILGAVLVATGIGAAAGALVIGAGIAIIGGGALLLSSGIKQENFNRAYNEEYDKGLRQTTLDDWVDMFYNYKPGNPFGYKGQTQWASKTLDGPSDDTIQWLGDCVTDLWFESSINTSLRNHFFNDTTPTYMDAPGRIESGNNTPIDLWELFGIYYSNSNSQRYPISSLERHLVRKLLAFDQKRDDNKYYIGIALGEYYNVNPDYLRKNKEKIYYHLPLEYDCCSECQEDFPHRVHYSEQSYQEELSDNYRIFLPNNYRDLEGETGEVTNIFKIGNNLFIHTREAIWQIPRSYQERVTDQIVSFIGTGSYFEIPPQKIIDDDTGSSAGCQHKWSTLKTPNGVFFISENQRKVYQFDGQQLKPISNIGIANWFQNNTKLKVDEQYYNSKKDLYPYRDNPSNPFGSGFISTYDTKKDRVIFTKKDFLLSDSVIGNPDFELCIKNGQVIIFPNFSQIVATEQENGWTYNGIDDCRLVFSKDTLKSRIETREITTKLPNTADIIVWLDTSGSFDAPARQVIKDAVGYYDTNGNPTPSNSWLASFASSNPDWTGNFHYLELIDSPSESERWLHSLEVAKSNIYGGNINGKNIIMVSFVNEANDTDIGDYHTGNFDGNIDPPTGGYMTDYNTFINIHDNEIVGNGGSFYGLSYPIVFTGQSVTEEFLKHVLAAVKGIPYTLSEVDALIPNPAVSNWNTMKTALQSTNAYPDNGIGGLNQFGWQVITNRYWSGSGQVITPEQFQIDMNKFLEGITSIEQVEVTVYYIETEYKYIDGQTISNPSELDNSWTISYSLKQNHWVSWHSYLPNFYINVPDKFYSWKYGNNNIWKHTKQGHYQTFYGILYPWIIEYVSLSNPLNTRIWDYITLLLEAKKFIFENNEFVDVNDVFFNKVIAYNSRQCSGLMNIKVKDADPNGEDYLYQQINNLNNNEIIADRNERNWNINNLRDIRTDYNKTIFISDLASLQTEYFIDKILNTSSIDYNKDWTELESFRDKYLAVRLIFDKFADVKLLLNFSEENEVQSFR